MSLLGLLLLVCVWSPVESTCGPVEELHRTTLTCDFNRKDCHSRNLFMYWKAETNTGDKIIANCSLDLDTFQCESAYKNHISATASDKRSTLTIDRVSRTDPLNMETKWWCQTCTSRYQINVCDKLQVYANPQSSSCTITEHKIAGKISYVTVKCSTDNVYPKAKCTFYRSKNGGPNDKITKNLSYKHFATSTNPVYYSSECSVNLTVKELGKGTHSFSGYIYPNVTDGHGLVQGTDADKTVTLKPPPLPPLVTVAGQSYQGTASSNIVKLTEGYTGNVTCRVDGGYPSATNTRLKCGQLETTGAGNNATLSSVDPLMKGIDRIECYCTSQYVSDNSETKLTLESDVLYPPEISFPHHPISTVFNKGDNVTLICDALGNPQPSLTLTRERTDEVLTNVQERPLIDTLDALDCLDTDVYVCSGQNSVGTASKNISINVNCPQQFNITFEQPFIIDAVMGGDAQVDLEIYGFPEPSSLYLTKTTDSTNPRHAVKYAASDAPFGVVTVTVFDLAETDFANYTLTVGNGVGKDLTFTFSLNEVNAGGSGNGSGSGMVVGVVVLVILVIVAVVAVVMLHRKGKLPGQKRYEFRGDNRELPIDLKENETDR